MFRAPFRAPFGRGIQTKKIAEGGSETSVGIATEAGGQKIAIGGSEVSLSIGTEGGGVKRGIGGAEASVYVRATGGGKKVVPPALQPARELRAKVFVNETEYDDRNIAAISLDETVNPDDSFSIGAAASAKLELTLLDIPRETVFDGAIISPYLGFLEDGQVAEYIPLGVFAVEEIDWHKDGSITSVTLTCFDRMVLLETAYILSALDYPAPLQDVAAEIAQKAGLTFNAASLAAIPTTAVDELMGYTLREAIGYVASYVGGFAHFNRAGELEVSTYIGRRDAQGSPLPDISPANCISFETSEKEFAIGRLACQAGEDEDGNPLVLVAGITGNEITFENPWMTQGRLDALHAELTQLSYMPYTLRWQGDPALRAGDTVSIADRKGSIFTTLIMEQNLRYDGGLGATAEAKGKTELAQEFQSAGPLTLKLSRQASVKAYADRVAKMIVDGEFEDGTFIDGNMIVSPIIAGMECRITGEIKVGGLDNNVAGISGDGSTAGSIRFWAGHATKAQAPFRVTQDGKLTATNAELSGRFTVKYSSNTIADLYKNDAGGILYLFNNAGNPVVRVGAALNVDGNTSGFVGVGTPVSGAVYSRAHMVVHSTYDYGYLSLYNNASALTGMICGGSSTGGFGCLGLKNRSGYATVELWGEMPSGMHGAILVKDSGGNTKANINAVDYSYIPRLAIGKLTIGSGIALDVNGVVKTSEGYNYSGYSGITETFEVVGRAELVSASKLMVRPMTITVKGGIITNVSLGGWFEPHY